MKATVIRLPAPAGHGMRVAALESLCGHPRQRRPAVTGLIVIGSGPAGLAAARAYRDAGGRGAVRMITEDADLPYNRPPLSKDFLRGEAEEGSLALTDEAFFAVHDIEVDRSRSVRALVPATRSVVLDDGSSLGYDVCVVATGAEPVRLKVPGGDDERLHRLRSLADARTLRHAAESARKAVVIGSGFIGCEAAASLVRRRVQVTLISNEQVPQGNRLGPQAGARIAGWLRAAGVTVVTRATVQGIEFAGGQPTIHLRDDRPVTADLILVCAGVEPRVELASDLKTVDGRIAVDRQLRTSAEGVFAAGDVAAAENARAGRRITVEHWSDAEAMGAVAGANAAGAQTEWGDVPGFWSEIGDHQLKYHAWGDGFDTTRLVDHGGGSFTVWYAQAGVVVAVLTHDADADYERGEQLIAEHTPIDDIS